MFNSPKHLLAGIGILLAVFSMVLPTPYLLGAAVICIGIAELLG